MRNIVFHSIAGKFALDGILCSAGSVSVWISALDHKSVNDPVEGQTVIKIVLYQLYKICDCDGCGVCIQLYIDLAIILYGDGSMMGSCQLLAGIDHSCSCHLCILGTIGKFSVCAVCILCTVCGVVCRSFGFM